VREPADVPFATVGDLRMHYEWHGRETGTPLVLIMGLGGDSTAWGLQLAAVAPFHRGLLFDNRGVGRTDTPDALTRSAKCPETSSVSSMRWRMSRREVDAVKKVLDEHTEAYTRASAASSGQKTREN
jgi:pimeloyl-ACP methyl ester carboxylesterase